MLLQSLLRPVLTPLMRGMFDAPIFSSAPWSPLALWPDGIATPGMWISPRDLTSQWADYLGTTPVATPGTVADSSNPVGLALDIRAGAPEVLGPDAVVNGDFSDGTTGWSITGGNWSVAGGAMQHTPGAPSFFQQTRATLPLGAGKWFELVYTVSGRTAGGFTLYFAGSSFYGFDSNGTKSIIYNDTGGSYVLLFDATADYDGAIDNISVKEVPGNHMLQSTSAARPLLSARVNLLTYTEDFSHTWGWPNGDIATTNKLAAAANSSPHGVRRIFPTMNNPQFTVRASAAEYGFMHLVSGPGISPDDGVSYCATFDLVNGAVIKDGSWGTSAQIVAVGGGVYDCSVVSTHSGSTDAVICYGPTAATNTYLGDGTSGVNVFRAQISYQGTDYQAVLGDGSTYASGPPIAQLYDGIDDSMATAAFAAGTLLAGMDCLIAVRRDSAANMILAYSTPGDVPFFGAMSPGGSSDCSSGAGTPTVHVDGVQLAGGTAVTRGTLDAALTVGEWHILEFRNLDLSAWLSFDVGAWASGWQFNGARGDILLFPSTANTEDKDAARQWLADYYGVTLP